MQRICKHSVITCYCPVRKTLQRKAPMRNNYQDLTVFQSKYKTKVWITVFVSLLPPGWPLRSLPTSDTTANWKELPWSSWRIVGGGSPRLSPLRGLHLISLCKCRTLIESPQQANYVTGREQHPTDNILQLRGIWRRQDSLKRGQESNNTKTCRFHTVIKKTAYHIFLEGIVTRPYSLKHCWLAGTIQPIQPMCLTFLPTCSPHSALVSGEERHTDQSGLDRQAHSYAHPTFYNTV